MSEPLYKIKTFTGIVPLFCPLCGDGLRNKKYPMDFDTITGKRKYGTHVFCPDFLGKSLLSHYNIMFDENGDEIVERYA